MRRFEDEKMFYRPPLLEEPCAQTLSGTKLYRNINIGHDGTCAATRRGNSPSTLAGFSPLLWQCSSIFLLTVLNKQMHCPNQANCASDFFAFEPAGDADMAMNLLGGPCKIVAGNPPWQSIWGQILHTAVSCLCRGGTSAQLTWEGRTIDWGTFHVKIRSSMSTR